MDICRIKTDSLGPKCLELHKKSVWFYLHYKYIHTQFHPLILKYIFFSFKKYILYFLLKNEFNLNQTQNKSEFETTIVVTTDNNNRNKNSLKGRKFDTKWIYTSWPANM